MSHSLTIDDQEIARLCERHRIKELSLFGSVLRDDFRTDSDVDLLVLYEDGHRPGIDEYIAMREDFEALFGREVDLVNKNRLENPFLRRRILRSRKTIYAA